MNPYPPVIRSADVFDPPRRLIPRRHREVVMPRSSRELPVQSSVDRVRCGVSRLSLRSMTTGRATQTSHTSEEWNHGPIASDAAERFHFAPRLEDVRIHWGHDNPEAIAETVVELWARIRGDAKRVWSKTFRWNRCPEDARAHFSGDLTPNTAEADKRMNVGAAGVVREFDANGEVGRCFPAGCVTAEHGPYAIVVRVVPRQESFEASPSCRWVYFDILVDGITLEWCPPELLEKIIPETNKARNLEVCRALTDPGDQDNLAGALPAADVPAKKVLLKSHVFYAANEELIDMSYFTQYRDRWGDGPLIPIFAKATVRMSNGERTFVPEAVGGARFMWDWVDKGDLPSPIADAAAEAWISDTRAYKVAETPESPRGHNCHVERGGKRGPGAKTCFPGQAGRAPTPQVPAHDHTNNVFPFEVVPCNGGGSTFTRRRWAAMTRAWPKGELAGRTGVLFQPSRMAGDGYQLHVYLAYDTDAEMQGADPATFDAKIHAKTGTFQVWRQLTITDNWRLGTGTPSALIDLAAVQTKFKRYFIRLDLPHGTDTANDRWFNALQVVCSDPQKLFPWIAASLDLNRRDKLIQFRPYDEWYRELLQQFGNGDEGTLLTWADNQQNGVDQFGNPRGYVWEVESGKGNSPVKRPWPAAFAPDDSTPGTGVIKLSFPNLPVADHDVEFASTPFTFGQRHAAEVSTEERQKLKVKLDEALRKYHTALGETPICSYGRGKFPHLHVGLPVRLTGQFDTLRRRQRATALRELITALLAEISYESGKATYEGMPKYGWIAWAFDAALEELFANTDGIVAIQVTDVSDASAPSGKAFYSGNQRRRAAAVTLSPDPKQATFEHEIGHALFLNHTYGSEESHDPHFTHQAGTTAGACVMNKAPSTSCNAACIFCGFCLVRLWGWSYRKVDLQTGAPGDVRTIWYDASYNKFPGAPGAVPRHPKKPEQPHPG